MIGVTKKLNDNSYDMLCEDRLLYSNKTHFQMNSFVMELARKIL